MARSVDEAFGRAVAALQAGRPGEAERAFRKTLELSPRHPAALNLYTVLLMRLGRWADAEPYARRAARETPGSDVTLYNFGLVLKQVGKPAEALEQLGRALAVNPGVADTRITRAGVLRDLGRLDEALAEIDAALALESARTDALVARGGMLGQLGRFPEALAAFDQALARTPDLAEAWVGIGDVFSEQRFYERAVAAYDGALARDPGLARAWLHRARALLALGRFAEAREAWGRAAVPAATVETWVVGADIASASRDFAGALAAFDAALALDPDLELVPGARLQTRLQLCDWTNLDAEVARLLAAVRDGRRVAQPFNILVLSASPADQRRCAEIYANDVTATVAPPWRREPQWRDSQHRDRIRIAYASADLRDHPTAYLTAGLFEHHDRSRFEVIAIVWGERGGSDIARRIDAAVDRVVDIGRHGDAEAAALIGALDIDILVDLMGFTEGHRFPVLARRPAPIQVTYLGFPGTLGSTCIDYLVADPVVIPDAQRHHYAEHVVRLPHCYQVNDDRRAIAAQTPSRSDCGLPDHAFVFCCFNSSFKIQPAVFDVWIRLLAAVEGSVLWLLDDDPVARDNLRREAQARGVDADRLVFAPRCALPDHLARHRLADLFVDTQPYNAHTTASDALWSGLPVVTCEGTTFAGRVCASLLRAVGLPELVAASLVEYEATALALAADRGRLAALRARLGETRETAPLFDTARFTRHIEAAYREMWRRRQDGEPPAGFDVPA
ncbi:MAG: tetratricopeptide repeat protein [Rhodovulum sp.]|nr:tetratricopeptide repeat protein [Rhodovulum sp.]